MKKIFLLFFLFCASVGFTQESLLLMAGAASAPVVEELGKAFTQKTGIRVDLSIGGSGMLLSQIKLGQKGDLYLPASSDFIEKARKENLILENTITPLVYLVPAICVQKGNPRNIKSLKDLCQPGIRVAIAQPETVAIGVVAVEIIENCLNEEEKAALKKNIVAYTQNVEKTANALILNTVDAIIGWRVLEHWKPDRIETIKPPADEVIRICYLAIAVTKFAKKPETAKAFIEFMKSAEGLKFFEKFNYFTSVEAARSYIGTETPVIENEYEVPGDWIK